MDEQSLTYFEYVCFMPRNDEILRPYCWAYHELGGRTVSGPHCSSEAMYNHLLSIRLLCVTQCHSDKQH
jgi:hypothetical protein